LSIVGGAATKWRIKIPNFRLKNCYTREAEINSDAWADLGDREE
jgi:hypothetical protein